MPKWRRFRKSSNPSIAAAETEAADVIFDKVDSVAAQAASAVGGAIAQGTVKLEGVLQSVEPVVDTIASGLEASLSQFSYTGSTGNFNSALEHITLAAKFQGIVEQYPEKIGSPLHKAVYLNTLSGFVLCENPSFAATTATAVEETAIESFLASGLFLE